MSTFAIDDLLVAEESLRDLSDRELKITGGAAAGASSAADYNDALAASGATTRGGVYARAEGSYYYYDRYSYPWGSYSYSSSGGPSASVDAYNYW